MKKRIHVVGAVIVHDGEVLCARRGGDGALAGMWEFPGGKIEDGELPREALQREIAEELLCGIGVGEEITTTTHEYDFGIVILTTFHCRLLSGTPQVTEHAEMAWLSPESLGALEWAPADIPTVDAIAAEFLHRRPTCSGPE